MTAFLQAGLDEMKARYGSVENYLMDGLGLSKDEVQQLKVTLVSHSKI